MLKNRLKTRRGALLIDALVALVIFALGIIPIVGSIIVGYRTTVNSADISSQLNEFYDRVDGTILKHTLQPGVHQWEGNLETPVDFIRDGTVIIDKVEVVSVTDQLNIGPRRIPMKVYMIKLPYDQW